jgi:hypothetical protein
MPEQGPERAIFGEGSQVCATEDGAKAAGKRRVRARRAPAI